MIGPREVTREEKMNIANGIAKQLLDKYGADVEAIGIYGVR